MNCKNCSSGFMVDPDFDAPRFPWPSCCNFRDSRCPRLRPSNGPDVVHDMRHRNHRLVRLILVAARPSFISRSSSPAAGRLWRIPTRRDKIRERKRPRRRCGNFPARPQQWRIEMLTLHDHEFQGPILDPNDLPEADGVYVVTTTKADGGVVLLDCGESGNIRERIASHDREDCWKEHAAGGQLAFFHYVTNDGPDSSFRRGTIEYLIRHNEDLPCGKE